MAIGLLDVMEKWGDNVCQRNMYVKRIKPHSHDKYLWPANLCEVNVRVFQYPSLYTITMFIVKSPRRAG